MHDKLGEAGWPNEVLFTQVVEGPISSASFTVDGKDQGSGNSGSLLCAALLSSETDESGAPKVKSAACISYLGHETLTYTKQFDACDDLVSAAEAGDSVAIVVVSAPYPGMSAEGKVYPAANDFRGMPFICSTASLTLH